MESGTFTIRVKDKFSAAHTLIGYPGDCGKLHGHTFHVEVQLEYTELDNLNMAIDFRAIKEVLKPLVGHLDHSYLNDVLLECAHPTAEYLAKWFYTQLGAVGYPVASVIIWESENAGVEYREYLS